MTADEWSAKRDAAWDRLQTALDRLRDESERLQIDARQAALDLQVCEDGFREARDAERGGSAQNEKGDNNAEEILANLDAFNRAFKRR